MKKLLIPLMVVMLVISSVMPAYAKNQNNPGPNGNKNGNKKACAFEDMKGHWGESLVEKMAERGIAKGAYGKFQPNKAITRAEFIALLHRVLQIQPQYDEDEAPDINEIFKDVPNNSWYADELYDLVDLGIVDFKDEFKPNKAVSRQEMAHLIMNSYRYAIGDLDNELKDILGDYLDDHEISSIYKNDMTSAVKLGLILGDGKKNLRPNASTSRVEAIVVLYRFMFILETIDWTDTVQKARVEIQPSYELTEDTLEVNLTITNKSRNTVTINHRSGQKFDFELLNARKKVIYRWSKDRKFTQALSETKIEPGDDVTFSVTLDIEDYEDIIEDAKYLKAYIIGTSKQFDINKDGYMVEIEQETVKTADVEIVPGLQYRSGKYIMKLSIKNNSDKNITLELSSQKYDFAFFDEDDKELYRWSDGKVFNMMVILHSITPGETLVFTQELDKSTYRRIIDDAEYMKAYIVGSSEDFTINEDGYTLDLD